MLGWQFLVVWLFQVIHIPIGNSYPMLPESKPSKCTAHAIVEVGG